MLSLTGSGGSVAARVSATANSGGTIQISVAGAVSGQVLGGAGDGGGNKGIGIYQINAMFRTIELN